MNCYIYDYENENTISLLVPEEPDSDWPYIDFDVVHTVDITGMDDPLGEISDRYDCMLFDSLQDMGNYLRQQEMEDEYREYLEDQEDLSKSSF